MKKFKRIPYVDAADRSGSGRAQWDEGTREFPLSLYALIPFQPLVSYVNQPKVLAASISGYY
jgi:hypothetical protein